MLIRPEQVELSSGDDAEITTVEYYGHDVRYELLLADGTMLSARTHPTSCTNAANAWRSRSSRRRRTTAFRV